MNEIIVEEAGKRIDMYVAEKLEISRVTVQRLIEDKKIILNGKSIKPSYKVKEGDIIKYEMEEPKEINVKPEDIPLEVLYEDSDIIVINKPKGMVVHPANGNWKEHW